MSELYFCRKAILETSEFSRELTNMQYVCKPLMLAPGVYILVQNINIKGTFRVPNIIYFNIKTADLVLITMLKCKVHVKLKDC